MSSCVSIFQYHADIIGEDGKKVWQRVDCWLNKPQKNQAVSTTVKEREIVLDPKPPPLSLGNACTYFKTRVHTLWKSGERLVFS